MLYHLVKLLFSYIIPLFYRSVTLINPQAVQPNTPSIIYSSHGNYLIDGQIQILLNTRTIRMIVANISLKLPILKYLIKAYKVIGIDRTVDAGEQKGMGEIISVKGDILKGQKTNFTQLIKNSSITLQNGEMFKIKKILSDNQLQIERDSAQSRQLNQQFSGRFKPDFDKTYNQVWSALNNNDCLTIFPEGHTHDLLQLRPLKAGVCIMALGAVQKYGTKVKLIPSFMHYYNQHQTRSKVIVQYGDPFEIPPQIVEKYSKDRKEAVNDLLILVDKNIRALSLEYDQYDQLPALLLARQLYVLDSHKKITDQQKLNLNRSFSRGFKAFRNDPKFKHTHSRLVNFSQFLKERDISVRNRIKVQSTIAVWMQFVKIVIECSWWSLMVLPGKILWGPLLSLVYHMSENERTYWSKLSNVKQHCHHLESTQKIFLLMMLLPLVFIATCILLYPLCQYFGIQHYWLIISLLLLIFELFYATFYARCIDKLWVSWGHLKVHYLRFFEPQTYASFEKERKELQQETCLMMEQLERKEENNFKQNKMLMAQDSHTN